jgi:hypothetical protein
MTRSIEDRHRLKGMTLFTPILCHGYSCFCQAWALGFLSAGSISVGRKLLHS